jgi:nitrate/TMAO reductase-like tetraheme cytochrome c subunit
MSEPVLPSPSSGPAKPRSVFNNWISAIGGVLAIGALFSFAFLVWMDFSQGEKNPYLGILTYIVAPLFLVAGIAMSLIGALMQRSYALRHAGDRPDRWQIDFANRRQRRLIMTFAIGGITFVMLSAFGSYQTYHYSESTQFCGEVCHKAMSPEYTAYKRGAHARVECVECHVGSGAQWFVKAKINGTHQLIAYTLDNYKRPIATPIKNLRPAQDICEKCHWPAKFHGNIDVNFDHVLSDKKNTPFSVRMLMHVNQSVPGGPAGGIHWHVNPDSRVEYYAADEKRQQIPWMRVVNTKDGTSRVFRTEDFKGEPPADQVRTMDCMDCHNRPAHTFPTANDSVEKSIVAGRISTRLPNIKMNAVKALTETKITTQTEAPQKIADFMRSKYPDRETAADVTAAITELETIYASTIFPERKADWTVYPNNIGHKDWPGCFRCHDDKHKTAQGQTVRSSDCTSCHTIIAQGNGTALETLSAKGLKFDHPGGELDPDLTCSDCHNGGIQK